VVREVVRGERVSREVDQEMVVMRVRRLSVLQVISMRFCKTVPFFRKEQ